jgi:hypothetical protein
MESGMRDLGQDLKERDGRYGVFREKAAIAQHLKQVMQAQDGWSRLTCDKREALEQIATKIGRILNGDPEYQDSWYDISGYAKLIADGLEVSGGGGSTNAAKPQERERGGRRTGVALRKVRKQRVPRGTGRERSVRQPSVRAVRNAS